MSTFDGPVGILDNDDDVYADCFAFPQAKGQRGPSCAMLSHAHEDHTRGLPSLDGSRLYATAFTRLYLSKYTEAHERRLDEAGLPRSERKYRRCLKRNNWIHLEYDTPIILDTRTSATAPVRMTPIDANHCPGSCMFLYEKLTSDKSKVLKAVLYCGDIRIDADHLERLQAKPYLQPFLGPKPATRLAHMVLDTSAVLSDNEVLTKLFKLYPPETKFFLNVWTTGYEDLVLAIARAFIVQIHVDKFKRKVWSHLSALRPHLTDDPRATRFHACEKTFKCDEVWNNGRGCTADFASALDASVPGKKKRFVGCGCRDDDSLHQGEECRREDESEGLVVYVNPIEPYQRDRYAEHKAEVTRRIKRVVEEGKGKLPTYILAPLGRHSALPELKRFVDLFKPSSLVPNTIYDRQNVLDYFALSRLFSGVLGPGAEERIQQQAKAELAKRKAKRGIPTYMMSEMQQQVGIDVMLDLGETVDHLGGMFAHLDGPPELMTAVERALLLKDADEARKKGLEALRKLAVGQREHVPAALQGVEPDRRKRPASTTALPLEEMPADSAEMIRRAERAAMMVQPAPFMMQATGGKRRRVDRMRPKSPVKQFWTSPSLSGNVPTVPSIVVQPASSSLTRVTSSRQLSSTKRKVKFTFELNGETQVLLTSTAPMDVDPPAPLPTPPLTPLPTPQETVEELPPRAATYNTGDIRLLEERRAAMPMRERERRASNWGRSSRIAVRRFEEDRIAKLAAAMVSGEVEPRLETVESQLTGSSA